MRRRDFLKAAGISTAIPRALFAQTQEPPGQGLLNKDHKELIRRSRLYQMEMDFYGTENNTDPSRYLTKMDISGIDTQNLGRLRTDGLYLADLDLSGSNFSRSVFYRPNLGSTNFSGANFSGASKYNEGSFFGYGDASRANFSNSSMVYTYFSDMDLFEADFKNANLLKSVFSGKRTKFSGVRLEGANLQEAQFTNIDLSGEDFSKAGSLNRADFSECDLGNTTFNLNEDLLFTKFYEPKNFDSARFLYKNRIVHGVIVSDPAYPSCLTYEPKPDDWNESHSGQIHAADIMPKLALSVYNKENYWLGTEHPLYKDVLKLKEKGLPPALDKH
ncbi:MAG: pentapeptide repeat-containing protein [Alphaproteobacteria bacterium]|nr:pentapeptide repeat-containing protein [Alphaproteobacteria bacterium]